MGVCASCLGLNRHTSRSNSPERERLLRHDSSNRRQYGANTNSSSEAAVDPEQLKRERDALEQICAQTADNLIDITRTDGEAMAAFGGTGNSKTTSDYARLFREIFPPPPPIAHDMLQQSTTPSAGAMGSERKTEQQWLRRIMAEDPEDNSWDCNIVHEINKPLTFTFD